jgi:hypothetical protein
MTVRWTVFAWPVTCGSGYGEHVIVAGDPVCLVGPLRRCAAHASTPVDQAAVDQARHALEAAAAARSHSPGPPGPPGPPRRVSRRRPVQPFTRVGDLFDPKALAAGERES